MSAARSTRSDPLTGLVFDEIYLDHDPGLGHPESPLRLGAILDGLRQAGLLERLARIEPLPAELEWVHAVHTRQYVRLVEQECQSGRAMLSTGDTNLCRASYRVALAAAGGAVAAVRAVLDGRVRNAFCALRPPGHHAWSNGGMGFCVFNNAAIAARYAQRHGGLGRVLIFDWDVHHGNGTQEIFYDDPAVLYCSIHSRWMYPIALTGLGHAEETGPPGARGTNLNIPLPPGSGDADVLAACREQLLPAAEKFKPDLVVLSAGFDSRQGDPLGNLRLTDEGYAELTHLAMGLAPSARLVSVLEGGYSLKGLASASAAHLRALMGE